MLIGIAIILLALWIIGELLAFTAGGLIHILLVVAVVMFLVRIIQGKNPLK